MKKQNEFLKNTLILFLGKFCTQFISFLLLPLYTRYLLASDYGFVDLLQTYILLFVPVLTLRFDSAVFRFLIDERKNDDGKKTIISNVLISTFFQIVLFILIFLFIICFFNIKYKFWIGLNIIILMLSNILLQIARGLGKNLDYSVASIITGIVTLITNLILIIGLDFNASSILISSFVANLFCCTYIFLKNKIYLYINFKFLNKKTIKSLLYYSLPMIPNSLSWWIVGVSDRTIIAFFINVAANGIYTVSCKFSNILNSIFSIFNMSWQETASIHIDDSDRDSFFTKMINEIFFLFITISILIICALPVLFSIVIGNDYLNSYNYIPILLYANIWNILIGLIGGIYVAKKKTKEIAYTTIFSAILNLIINIALIQKIGLYAACISTLISYMVMGIYRYIDCKKYVNVKLDLKKFFLFNLIFALSSVLYYINNLWLNIFNILLVFIISFLFNYQKIKKILIIIRNKIINIKFTLVSK